MRWLYCRTRSGPRSGSTASDGTNKRAFPNSRGRIIAPAGGCTSPSTSRMIEPEVSGEFVPPLLKDVKCRRIREFEGPPGCVRLVSTGLSKLRTFNHQWHSITSGPTMSDITFQGIDDKECESFIRAVTRKGFVDERDTDDNWMARFAATCFEGPALRWYDQLTEETQGSWRSLRKALLSQYPARP